MDSVWPEKRASVVPTTSIHRTASVTTSSTTIEDVHSFASLTDVGSVIGKLHDSQAWREAVVIVIQLVRNSILGGCVGWCVNFVFAQGNFLSGRTPVHQSYASFCAGIMGQASILETALALVVQAAAMLHLHFIDRPDKRPTLWKCMWRLMWRTWIVNLITFWCVVVSAYMIASLSPRTHPWKLHVYLSGVFPKMAVTNLGIASSHIFKLETVEGQRRQAQNVARIPRWKRVARMIFNDFHLLVTIYVAAAYIQISNILTLDTPKSMMLFTSTSLVIKFLIQQLTREVLLRNKKTPVKAMYIALSLPTVLIDTQVRVVILKQPNVSQSIALTIAIAIAELGLRHVKVWVLRYEVRVKRRRMFPSAHSRSNSSRKNASDAGHSFDGSAAALTELSVRAASGTSYEDSKSLEFQKWCHRVLTFHAAEVYADMYAEYLAIVCSMSIYFFFHDHPKYAWKSVDTHALKWSQQAVYLVGQIGIEMVVDALGCVWELANGVPLLNAKHMSAFVTILFVSCSAFAILLTSTIGVSSST